MEINTQKLFIVRSLGQLAWSAETAYLYYKSNKQHQLAKYYSRVLKETDLNIESMLNSCSEAEIQILEAEYMKVISGDFDI